MWNPRHVGRCWNPRIFLSRLAKTQNGPNCLDGDGKKSADPGLCQGRGGAWDHRRCGSCLSWTFATPWILSFLHLCHAHTAGKRHHKATAMAQEHPTAAAMVSFIGVQGCRLLSLKPSKPSNSSKSLPNSAGKRHPTAAAMASFIGVQGCHLPDLKRSKRSKPSTSPPSSAGKRYPNKPNTRHSRMQNAQLRRQTVPQQAQQAPRPQAKATTRPQQWLKASPRPQQWLLIGVPGSKPSKRPPSSAHSRMQNAQLRRQKVPQQAPQAPRRSKRSKPSKRPPSSAGKRYPNKPNTRHSRLKRSKRSKPSTRPPRSAGKR